MINDYGREFTDVAKEMKNETPKKFFYKLFGFLFLLFFITNKKNEKQ